MQKQNIPKKEKVSSRKKTPTEACPLEIRAHIRRLGLFSVKAYKRWCRAHHLSQGLHKSRRQRRKELDFVDGIKATATLRKKKKNGSILTKVIPMIGALGTRYGAEWKAVEERYDAEWDEIWERFYAESGNKRYGAEQDAIKERYDAEWDALRKRYGVEQDELRACYPQEKILKDVESAIDVKLGEITREVVKRMLDAFKNSGKPELLQDCLLHLDVNSNLLRGENSHYYGYYSTIYIGYIQELVDDFENWVRPLQGWHPKSHSPSRQFSELLRHIYAAYPVPRFMDRAWKKGRTERHWFKHVAAGQNIRTAEDLPIPLTKKMAHYFLMAPHHYNIEKAFVWGQVRSIGGGRCLVNALWKKFGADALGGWDRFVEDNDFWLNVMRFFGANPKLEGSQVDLIVDYVYAQKYENARDHTDFSMKGRTADALLRQAEAWQQDLKGVAALEEVRWQRSGIGEFHFQEVDTPSGSQKSWSIRELCSTIELAKEGRALLHCLSDVSHFNGNFSYAKRCYTGEISIWTLEMREDASKSRKVLTISVSLGGIPRIAEVSGRRNRNPSVEEIHLIEKWADQEELEFKGANFAS